MTRLSLAISWLWLYAWWFLHGLENAFSHCFSNYWRLAEKSVRHSNCTWASDFCKYILNNWDLKILILTIDLGKCCFYVPYYMFQRLAEQGMKLTYNMNFGLNIVCFLTQNFEYIIKLSKRFSDNTFDCYSSDPIKIQSQ